MRNERLEKMWPASFGMEIFILYCRYSLYLFFVLFVLYLLKISVIYEKSLNCKYICVTMFLTGGVVVWKKQQH